MLELPMMLCLLDITLATIPIGSNVTPLICETWWRGVMVWTCMAATQTTSLIFIDDIWQ